MKNDKRKYNKNNMKPSLKTKPHNYAYCFATNEQCPQRRECLHALVAELPMKASRTPEVVICSIDPRYIATLEGKGGCALFRSSTPSRYACGMSQLYDEVPSKVVSQVRWKVQRCFTCRSFYFAGRKGERLISPDEQKKIAAVFRQLCPGIQPVYDRFEEAYEW